MKRFSSLALLANGVFCVFCFPAPAQQANADSQRQDRDALVESYRQLQESPSASASEAALDTGVIIDLLRKEPALALQIKKVLIKDALDQGRLLEQEDLTDVVLYDLIRREQTIRIIASKEIVARHYLDLKPTDEEILQARVERRQIERLESSEERRQQQKQAQEDEENGILPESLIRTSSRASSESADVG